MYKSEVFISSTHLCKNTNSKLINYSFFKKAYATAVGAGESQGCAILACLFPISLICIRGNAREKQGIEGSFCGDCASMAFCGKLIKTFFIIKVYSEFHSIFRKFLNCIY